MLDTIPNLWRSVLGKLVEAKLAWQRPSELAKLLSWSVEETTDLLADLDVAGWLEVWEQEGEPSVTLSALAAERLGVRLVECGPDQTPRWWPIGEPEPPQPRARHVCVSERSASFEFLIDPGPRPDELAAMLDLSATDEGEPRWPRPNLIIGEHLSPWPGPREPEQDKCPACHGRRLPSNAYCLRCDRWGLDGRLAAWVARSSSATAPSVRIAPSSPSLAAVRRAEARHQAARARRKVRRKAKCSAGFTSPQAPPRPAPGSDVPYAIPAAKRKTTRPHARHSAQQWRAH